MATAWDYAYELVKDLQRDESLLRTLLDRLLITLQETPSRNYQALAEAYGEVELTERAERDFAIKLARMSDVISGLMDDVQQKWPANNDDYA